MGVSGNKPQALHLLQGAHHEDCRICGLYRLVRTLLASHDCCRVLALGVGLTNTTEVGVQGTVDIFRFLGPKGAVYGFSKRGVCS